MSDDSLWLWLCASDGMGPKTVAAVWERLGQCGQTLEDFFNAGEQAWSGQFDLNLRAVKGLAAQKSRMNEIIELAEALRDNGVHLLALEHPRYPQFLRAVLGHGAPPLLYALGNTQLLERRAVAVVGARDASARGLTIARNLGAAFARHGLVLVSGGARGTDNAAHLGALLAGGATVIVLSCGILQYRPNRAVSENADPASVLYLSELPPHMTWQTGGAMARNRILCALASAVIVVEAGESGGTLQAAEKAMELGRPLFVAEFETYDTHLAGNERLLRRGGRPLHVECDPTGETWRVDLAPVLAAVDEAPSLPSRMDLFEQR